MAKADFIRLPDITLVQAFAVFLCLARRHDSPRWVWMMMGLAVRMGIAIGLHRDGSRFEHLSPYEVEMRRRVWWVLCMLDIRASEDQGTEFTVATGSFDTKMPLNINDADIDPEKKEAPVERTDETDMSYAMTSFQACLLTRKLMAAKNPDGSPDVAEQNRLLDDFRQDVETWGFSHHVARSQNLPYWFGMTVTRLLMAKLALFIHLPTLFSSPSEQFSDEVRNKLLVAALEVAEFNHALKSETGGRAWHWIIETYTHWHAIVYLLIEAVRRPWSPVVERAWTALHSRYLIPPQPKSDKSLRVWIPLRTLMARARRHRESELARLRGNAAAVEALRAQDRRIPVPTSSGPFKEGNSEEIFVRHWYDLVSTPAGYGVADPGQDVPLDQASRPQDAHAGLGSFSPETSSQPSYGLKGFDFTTGDWGHVDTAFGDFTEADVDMGMGDDVNWNTWLMEMGGMQGQQ